MTCTCITIYFNLFQCVLIPFKLVYSVSFSMQVHFFVENVVLEIVYIICCSFTNSGSTSLDLHHREGQTLLDLFQIVLILINSKQSDIKILLLIFT